MNEREAVMATLEDYSAAYCAKDIDALMNVFDDTENISLIGTGADELCGGRDAVKAIFLRNFEEATANQFEWHLHNPGPSHTNTCSPRGHIPVGLPIKLSCNW